MKRIERIIVMLSLMLFVLFIPSVDVHAESLVSKDNLDISIATDKDEYSENDDIKVLVTIKNNNDYGVSNIAVETLLPEGLVVKEGELNADSISIEAGATYSVNVVAKLSDDEKNNIGEQELSTNSSGTIEEQSNNSTDASSNLGGYNVESEPETGDSTNVYLWFVLLVASAGGLTLLFKFKRNKMIKFFSFIIFVGVVSIVFSSINVWAALDSSISVDKAIKVNSMSMVISANVKYNKTSINVVDTAAYEFYKENSEKIVSIETVSGNNTLSEKEVYTLLQERGFENYSITYDYNMNGEYVSDTNILKDSDVKHPMYYTSFVTNDNEVWNITIVGKNIYAIPLFYNMALETTKETLISENSILTSYDDDANCFYVTVPKNSVVDLKQIEQINTESIEEIVIEEAK